MAKLRARLDEHQVVLLGFLLALLGRDFALIVQIRLVSDKDNNNIVAAFRSDIVYPFSRVLKGLCVYVEKKKVCQQVRLRDLLGISAHLKCHKQPPQRSSPVYMMV